MTTKDTGGSALDYVPPCVTVAGVTVEHNTQSWRVAQNRHSNCDGTYWGWIENAPGNVCWSDNKTFNRAAAGEMVAAHNQWLEDQKPLSVKIIEARNRWSAAKSMYDAAKSAFDSASAAMDKCDEEMRSLLAARKEES